MSGKSNTAISATAQTRGLTPWVKGQSGNPKGNSSERRAFEAAVERHEIPKALALLQAMYDRGMKGDVAAATVWLNRVVGPVTDDETITAKAEKMLRVLLEEAETEARKQRGAIDVTATAVESDKEG